MVISRWLLAVAYVCGLGLAAKPPNFVVLFLDNYGWGNAGFNTNGTVIETPHMDRLTASTPHLCVLTCVHPLITKPMNESH